MLVINAKIREKRGKSANRRLRIANKLPAVIYGGNTKPIYIELEHEKIWNLQNKIEFYNEFLIVLLNNKKEERVRVQSIQRHSFKPKLDHIDFVRI